MSDTQRALPRPKAPHPRAWLEQHFERLSEGDVSWAEEVRAMTAEGYRMKGGRVPTHGAIYTLWSRLVRERGGEGDEASVEAAEPAVVPEREIVEVPVCRSVAAIHAAIRTSMVHESWLRTVLACLAGVGAGAVLGGLGGYWLGVTWPLLRYSLS